MTSILRNPTPDLEVTLDEATATRDSTDITSSDPESTAGGGSATGERQFAKNPGEAGALVDVEPVTIDEDQLTAPDEGDGLPADDEAQGPGLPPATIPGQGEDGPDPRLQTLAAWGGVLIAVLWVLNLSGVIDA